MFGAAFGTAWARAHLASIAPLAASACRATAAGRGAILRLVGCAAIVRLLVQACALQGGFDGARVRHAIGTALSCLPVRSGDGGRQCQWCQR